VAFCGSVALGEIPERRQKSAKIPEIPCSPLRLQVARVCTVLGFELISDHAPRRKMMLR
jgi:hypothetical protein